MLSVFYWSQGRLGCWMTSSPLLGSMRSVLALSFTAIPARHSHSALSVIRSWAEPPPRHRYSCNSINMVPITIWRCDANYIVATSRLLRKEAIFPATTHPHYNDSPLPKTGLSMLPTWRFIYAQLFNQYFLGGTKKMKCCERLGYFSFHCPPLFTI